MKNFIGGNSSCCIAVFPSSHSGWFRAGLCRSTSEVGTGGRDLGRSSDAYLSVTTSYIETSLDILGDDFEGVLSKKSVLRLFRNRNLRSVDEADASVETLSIC